MNTFQSKKSIYIQKNPENIEKFYKIESIIGSGTFSKVYKAVHIESGETRCIKVIKKKYFDKKEEDTILNEIEILRDVDHPFLVKIFEYFDTTSYVYIVMELLEGDNLRIKILNYSVLSEYDVKFIMYQILVGLAYLHEHQIIHRDLKPENIIFEKGASLDLKIIDFGLASTKNYIFENKIVGTLLFMAPEVMQFNYTTKCDIWSAGILLFLLITGTEPYDGNDKQIVELIKKGDIKLDDAKLKTLSKSLSDLLIKMLTFDQNKRPTAKECLQEPFFKGSDFNHQITTSFIVKMPTFSYQSELEKAINQYLIVSEKREEENEKLDNLFLKLDKNHNGVISKSDIEEYIENTSDSKEKNPELIANLIDKFGLDKKELEYSEFLNMTIKKRPTRRLSKIFKILDSDKDGFIHREDLDRFLGEISDKENKVKEIIKSLDKNDDNRVSFEEFQNFERKLSDKGD